MRTTPFRRTERQRYAVLRQWLRHTARVIGLGAAVGMVVAFTALSDTSRSADAIAAPAPVHTIPSAAPSEHPMSALR